MSFDNKDLSDEVKGKLRQFYRLLMSYNDFKQANQIATHILDEKLHDNVSKNRVLIEALNCAMIVAYARPFSGNDQKVDIKIPDLPENILKGLSEEEIEIHNVVLDDRNKVLAHSDSEAHSLRPEAWEINGKKILMPWSNDTRAPLIEKGTEIFMRLAEKLQERVYERRMKLEPELIEYFEVIPIDDVVDENA